MNKQISKAEKAQIDIDAAEHALDNALMSIMASYGEYSTQGKDAAELLTGREAQCLNIIVHHMQYGIYLDTDKVPQSIKAQLDKEFTSSMLKQGFKESEQTFTR